MNLDHIPELVVAILGALGGGLLGAVANGFFAREKTAAESDQYRASAIRTATETTLSLIGSLREEVTRLEARLENAERDAIEARDRADHAEEMTHHAERMLCLLRSAIEDYQRRVGYLTTCLEAAGVRVTPWASPDIPDLNGKAPDGRRSTAGP